MPYWDYHAFKYVLKWNERWMRQQNETNRTERPQPIGKIEKKEREKHEMNCASENSLAFWMSKFLCKHTHARSTTWVVVVVFVFVSWLCSIIIGKWKLLSMNQKGHIANTVTQFKVKLISQLVHQISTHTAKQNKSKVLETISYHEIHPVTANKNCFFKINTKENSVYVVLDSKNRYYVVPAIRFKYSSFVSCIVDIIFCPPSFSSLFKLTHKTEIYLRFFYVWSHQFSFVGQLLVAREWHVYAVKVMQNQR